MKLQMGNLLLPTIVSFSTLNSGLRDETDRNVLL